LNSIKKLYIKIPNLKRNYSNWKPSGRQGGDSYFRGPQLIALRQMSPIFTGQISSSEMVKTYLKNIRAVFCKNLKNQTNFLKMHVFFADNVNLAFKIYFPTAFPFSLWSTPPISCLFSALYYFPG
jgi:hypothetical protein